MDLLFQQVSFKRGGKGYLQWCVAKYLITSSLERKKIFFFLEFIDFHDVNISTIRNNLR